MSNSATFHLAIDYQECFFLAMPPSRAMAIKKAGRSLADKLKERGIETIWSLMSPTMRSRKFGQPAFNRAHDPDFLMRLYFDPALIRNGEPVSIKLVNSALHHDKNPMLTTLLAQHDKVNFVISGLDTTRCIACTVIDGSTHPNIGHITVMTKHLTDTREETGKLMLPSWHESKLREFQQIDHSRVTYTTLQSFMKKTAPV